MHVTIDIRFLLCVQTGIGGVAFSRIRPVDQTRANGCQADHLIFNVGVVVLQTLTDIVESVQSIESHGAHQILVLGA